MNVIVPAGGGNIGSVRYAFERLGIPIKISMEWAEISKAERIILPGVGAFDPGMLALESYGLVDCLQQTRQPILGICLGMQLLYQSSDEGRRQGLGLIDGRVTALRHSKSKLQMGWNNLQFVSQVNCQTNCQSDVPGRTQNSNNHTLAEALPPAPHCYFVHSYRAPLNKAVVATVDFEGSVPAIVRRGHVFGFQFHPERSGKIGEQLLRNFILITRCN